MCKGKTTISCDILNEYFNQEREGDRDFVPINAVINHFPNLCTLTHKDWTSVIVHRDSEAFVYPSESPDLMDRKKFKVWHHDKPRP